MEVAFEMNMGGVYQVVNWGRASRKRKQKGKCWRNERELDRSSGNGVDGFQ